MARTAKTSVRRALPALRSAPLPGFGVHRISKQTMSANTTIFRLLKVPKYAKRTVAKVCEQKNTALEEEMGRLKEDWMEQEREIEWLRRELERARGELEAVKGREKDSFDHSSHSYGYSSGYGAMMQGQGSSGQGQKKSLTESEKAEMEALWVCYQK